MASTHELSINTDTRNPEIPLEERTPLIKSRIIQILEMVDPSEHDKKEGFEFINVFDRTGDIESGSMGVVYWGHPEIGESLSFYRFHGRPTQDGKEFLEDTGKDKGIMISLYWNINNLNMPDGFTYSEWDAEDLSVKGEDDKTQLALDKIDSAFKDFRTVMEASVSVSAISAGEE